MLDSEVTKGLELANWPTRTEVVYHQRILILTQKATANIISKLEYPGRELERSKVKICS